MLHSLCIIETKLNIYQSLSLQPIVYRLKRHDEANLQNKRSSTKINKNCKIKTFLREVYGVSPIRLFIYKMLPGKSRFPAYKYIINIKNVMNPKIYFEFVSSLRLSDHASYMIYPITVFSSLHHSNSRISNEGLESMKNTLSCTDRQN